MGAQAYNLSTQETETGLSQTEGQPGLPSEFQANLD